jgi:hypothetical protein
MHKFTLFYLKRKPRLENYFTFADAKNRCEITILMKRNRNFLALNLLLELVATFNWSRISKYTYLSPLLLQPSVFKNQTTFYNSRGTSVRTSSIQFQAADFFKLPFSIISIFQELVNNNINQINFGRYGK